MKFIKFSFSLVLLLTACQQTPDVPATNTARPVMPTQTSEVSPTPTKDPLAGAPDGATKPDGKGGWIKVETENNNEYIYHWDEVDNEWKRPLIVLYMLDMYYNYIPNTLRISDKGTGEKNLISLTYTDVPEPSDGPSTVRPLTSVFFPELRQRLHNNDEAQIQNIMLGRVDGSILLPFTTSTGEKANGIMGLETGFITDIVAYSDLEPFIGKGVSRWQDPNGAWLLSTVTGVDKDGNILGKIAYEGDISDLSDEQVKWMIFSIIANVLEKEDQTTMSFTSLTDMFENYASKIREDGTQEVDIVRTP